MASSAAGNAGKKTQAILQNSGTTIADDGRGLRAGRLAVISAAPRLDHEPFWASLGRNPVKLWHRHCALWSKE
jgi:hypothetical protein